MKIFQERLDELIKEKFGTQKTFAEQFGYSKNQIHYWIKGKAEPDFETLTNLCRQLNTDPNYLLGFTDI